MFRLYSWNIKNSLALFERFIYAYNYLTILVFIQLNMYHKTFLLFKKFENLT